MLLQEERSSEKEGSTPLAQKWWLWVIVAIAVVGVIAGVGFAFLVRRRKAAKKDSASSDGGDGSPNFVFSTAYEVMYCSLVMLSCQHCL